MIAHGIAQCVNQWTRVETQMGLLFLTMLGVDHTAGAMLWNTYESMTAKDSALRSVAHARLRPDEKPIFEAIWRQYKANVRTRNTICHWQWGNIDDFADGMVVLDPRETVAHAGQMFDGASFTPSFGKLYLYREADLKRDARDFADLQMWLWKFAGIVANNPSRDELLSDLTTDARLAVRPSAQPQTDP